MKGIVFTEFLEMVEATWSLQLVDAILGDAAPASGGAYTAVGTYPAGEMRALVGALAARTDGDVAGALRRFGEHLVGPFARRFPSFFAAAPDALRFLAGVDGYVHQEVAKLYPDAELPRFACEADAPDRLVLVYRSQRCMADLAEGLIRGIGHHFGEPLAVTREDLAADGSAVRFEIRRAAA